MQDPLVPRENPSGPTVGEPGFGVEGQVEAPVKAPPLRKSPDWDEFMDPKRRIKPVTRPPEQQPELPPSIPRKKVIDVGKDVIERNKGLMERLKDG